MKNNMYGFRDFSLQGLYKTYVNPYVRDYGERVLGYRQYKNTQASLSAQIDYEQYLKAGNERALRDWHRNLPGREIQYPELSYGGQIHRANTSIATSGFSYDNAYSNFVGNLANKSMGLYSVPGRLYRSM